jgi:hypothetical protein
VRTGQDVDAKCPAHQLGPLTPRLLGVARSR